MVNDFYLLHSGHILNEAEMECCYEIVSGKRAIENSSAYEEWKKTAHLKKKLPANLESVRECMMIGKEITAMRIYREMKGCTLSEARDFISNYPVTSQEIVNYLTVSKWKQEPCVEPDVCCFSNDGKLIFVPMNNDEQELAEVVNELSYFSGRTRAGMRARILSA